MATPSFFNPQVPAVGKSVTLDERESHHAAGARRLRVGDTVRLLDGAGMVADGTIETLTKNALTVSIVQRQLVPAVTRSVHVVCALPKGDRQRYLLDMLTQIGITSFTPLLCERSFVKPKRALLERLQRVMIEACKQSQNPFLPELRHPMELADIMREITTGGCYCMVAHQHGDEFQLPEQNTLYMLVGPEGGFTEPELKLMIDGGAVLVSLGANILRIETAAVTGAGLLLAR